MKSKIIAFLGKPQVITAHYLIWEQFPDLLEEYNASGFCTGTYGGILEDMEHLEVSLDYIFDPIEQVVTKDTYSGSTFSYSLYLFLFFGAIVAVAFEIFYFLK
mmetsp:Transcript_11469/g.11471  ORF Transcript_11469/g.11471 Transcript_11469/m.11471 type:complete len:103 (-) Transcript_11469:40-348(-)